ncbi:hypothetical protein HDU67_006237 [Dinochytrium kinnereticum]|nr:hypothetical protein HDU67_006237 [Dinochytrium kinnereticum]
MIRPIRRGGRSQLVCTDDDDDDVEEAGEEEESGGGDDGGGGSSLVGIVILAVAAVAVELMKEEDEIPEACNDGDGDDTLPDFVMVDSRAPEPRWVMEQTQQIDQTELFDDVVREFDNAADVEGVDQCNNCRMGELELLEGEGKDHLSGDWGVSLRLLGSVSSLILYVRYRKVRSSDDAEMQELGGGGDGDGGEVEEGETVDKSKPLAIEYNALTALQRKEGKTAPQCKVDKSSVEKYDDAKAEASVEDDDDDDVTVDNWDESAEVVSGRAQIAIEQWEETPSPQPSSFQHFYSSTAQ